MSLVTLMKVFGQIVWSPDPCRINHLFLNILSPLLLHHFCLMNYNMFPFSSLGRQKNLNGKTKNLFLSPSPLFEEVFLSLCLGHFKWSNGGYPFLGWVPQMGVNVIRIGFRVWEHCQSQFYLLGFWKWNMVFSIVCEAQRQCQFQPSA